MDRKKILNVLGIVAILFVGIQFIRPNTETPDVDQSKDFLVIEKAPENIQKMVKNSCYDCHSYKTIYPWYDQIVPVSWYVAHHIKEGREEINFSTWADFPENRKNKRLKGSARLIRNDKMPLWDYKLIHPGSKLNDQQKEELASWFEKQAANYPVSAPPNKGQSEEHHE